MIDLIVQKLNDELVKNVGLNSPYTDDKIENIQRRLPDTVLTETFLGIVPSQEVPVDFEIGQRLATRWNYTLDLVLMVKDGDYDNGLNRLSKIVKRIIKSLSTSEVLTLSYNDSNISEVPYQMDIDKITYENGEAKTVFLHMSVITLSIKTNLII